MKIELRPRVTMSFDINVKALYNFCVEKRYINEDGYLETSMYEILCKYLNIKDYVENEEVEKIEDELRTMLFNMAYKDDEKE